MFLRRCAIFLIVLLGIATLGFVNRAQADLFEKHFIAVTPPRALSLLSFEDSHGTPLNLNNFKGYYVLLNLWATWCGPCVHEMPSLDLVSSYFNPHKFKVIAVNEDHDPLITATSFYLHHELSHLPIYIDRSGRLPSLVGARGMPTTLLINPDGLEIGFVEGEVDWSAPDALAFIEKYTKQ